MIKGRNILLGISGSIAAYKSATLTRLLIKEGANVKIIMTPSARDFISPLTLSTLSQNKVFTDISSEDEWSNHVELGLWADLMIVAPATANTIAKMRIAAADNMLIATYLSAKCPVLFAPAMDLDMWAHPANQENIEKLQSYGHTLINVGEGFLASGLEGKGRMAEPDNIIEIIKSRLTSDGPLKGKRVLVTAGPTYESIDPVRYIGNHSSGKMGAELALQAIKLGAEVDLVIGPNQLNLNSSSKLHIHPIQSAKEMFEKCNSIFPNADFAVMAAAVADYAPSKYSSQKVKKSSEEFELHLKKTKDIAKHLGSIKRSKQTLIGFALETENELEHAQSKLDKKNMDWIVLNSLKDKGAGFSLNTNKVTIISKEGRQYPLPLKTKREVSIEIWDLVLSKMNS